MRGPRCVVSVLYLANDFRLTQHHRVQSAGNAKEMTRGFEVFMKISNLPKVVLSAGQNL